MRIIVIGAGPTGLFLAATLALREHRVTVVDRDPGPTPDGVWRRRGVMQFHHAHLFRPQCAETLQTHLPDAYQAWLEAGAEPIQLTRSDGTRTMFAVRSRRQTFETALRATVLGMPAVTFHRGHVDAVTTVGGRAAGVKVASSPIGADLVIDASGRAGRVADGLRPAPSVGGNCGIAYVDRQYQLWPDAEPGPLLNPAAWQGEFDGYQSILFLHERGIFSVLLVRPTSGRDLVGLRHNEAFDAACGAISVLAAWTDPQRARPITDVLPGGTLYNYYRPQTGADGRLTMPGLISAGDAVCTTTPNFGRGITTSLLQAQELLRLVDEHGDDVEAVGYAFDEWCATAMRPWVEDHVAMDDDMRRRWEGGDIDLTKRLPSDLILAGAEADPAIAPAIRPYLQMAAGPSSLDGVEARARALYASGWRPRLAAGPSRRELAELVQRITGSK
ncbi:MAG TPA: FAD-dependent oxidoreductase [Propionibacteriaceae bacterium]|nr:FAD-dependent oxidoreductase [Propionibacteriaceae bacterium]